MKRIGRHQAKTLAEELRVTRARLFSLPSARGSDGVKEPPRPALRVFDVLFNEVVGLLPGVDEYKPGKGCPSCRAEEDQLVYDHGGATQSCLYELRASTGAFAAQQGARTPSEA